MMITGTHGVRMQYDFTQDIAGLAGAVSARSPRWLRLTRSGDTVTGYDSADGRRWTEVGAATLAGLSLYGAGRAVRHLSGVHESVAVFGGTNGQVGPSLATGVFDHVSLSGGLPGAAWTGDNVGQPGRVRPADRPAGGFRRAGGRFDVTGSGDIAPQVAGGRAAAPTRPSKIT